MGVADRIAVLYLGRLAAVGPASRFDTQGIVELMTTGASSRQDGDGAGPGSPAEQAAPAESDASGSGPDSPGDVHTGRSGEH
jgi:ABC-type sugar transport system ATPase subunit